MNEKKYQGKQPTMTNAAGMEELKSIIESLKLEESGERLNITVNIFNISINQETKKTEEYSRCTNCNKQYPIQDFLSKSRTGPLKQCKTCRNSKRKYSKRIAATIKENMVDTDTEKKCVKCGDVQSKVYFISNADDSETAQCLSCRKIVTSASKCVHNFFKIQCFKCNPTGYYVNNYRQKFSDFMKSSQMNYVLEELGCNKRDFMKYIEAKFKPDMNWDNYAKVWNFDHILPLMEIEDGCYIANEEIDRRMHYTNIQPLYVQENRIKSNIRK